MVSTLLYNESPIIGTITTLAPIILYQAQYYIGAVIALVILIFFIFFYRYYPCNKQIENHQVICPADGEITSLYTVDDCYHISIFLSPFNIHTQIYPVNGDVIYRYYDKTGVFDIVVDAEKSRNNEKKIHHIKMANGAVVKVTQIAGFLPRRITSSDEVPMRVKAGDYLGMIKFGSRVDLQIPKEHDKKEFHLLARIGQRITIGDFIGYYKDASMHN